MEMEKQNEPDHSLSDDLIFNINEDKQKTIISSVIELLDKLDLNHDSLNAPSGYQSDYFLSEESELIYYLAVLTGEAQINALKIAPSFYKDKKKAKAWRNKIIKKINPEKSQHSDAKKATEVLNSLYERMLKHAK
ncbi:hypothetical protein [Endozoicomonas sp. 4G]|uniref:hypothetical protein n=1 Tax=Endozoicomonas sp. 4G TaxID=2872754 RepID=UPI002078FADB|nr:hypothetical protein [Endozoicomonas sp. 4G]